MSRTGGDKERESITLRAKLYKGLKCVARGFLTGIRHESRNILYNPEILTKFGEFDEKCRSENDLRRLCWRKVREQLMVRDDLKLLRSCVRRWHLPWSLMKGRHVRLIPR